ncbi:MAG: hypothetical protein ACO1NQ_11000 [Flavobacteriales bacterium]
MTPRLDPELSALIERFPTVLSNLIHAELAAGNRIIDHGAGHPAPPAGAMVKFADAISSDTPTGLHIYARNSSLYHTEISDAQRFFWILTAALPPAPEPDMDRIRAAHAGTMIAAPIPEQEPGTIRMDIRGELLLYRETDRSTDIVWTWNNGNRLYPATLSPWWYTTERRSVAMTEAERERVLDRFIQFARTNIAADIIIED